MAQERQAQRSLMARKRALGRDLSIPPVANPRRRRRCKADPALFLRTYFPHVFYNPFSESQREIIAGFGARLRHGGWKAESAARGDGKTSIARGLAIWAIAYGLRRYLAIIAANGPDAERNRMSIRSEFERNDLFADDFPELCVPVRALEGANQRAAAQTVDGHRTYLHWSGEDIVMPTIEGAESSGAIITSRGIDSAIRGMNHRGVRPDFVIIDDPETHESARSEVEIRKREATIDSDVTGLAGPNKRLAIFYVCTIQTDQCLAARYTDRRIKSAWAGERRRMLIRQPDRMDLWEKYMDLRTTAMIEGDSNARSAHRFYLRNRRAMEKGAVLGNPFRFDSTVLPDGTQVQVSALQFCFDTISDVGWETFNAEYQSEPPIRQSADVADINARTVMQRCAGLDRGVIPADADHLVAGIDMGARLVHWSVLAVKAAALHVVDYGIIQVHSPMAGRVEDEENIQATQEAMLTALWEFESMASNGWPEHETGELRRLEACGIDVGYARQNMDDPVWQFVASAGGSYHAIKGFGSGTGQSRYRAPARKGRGRRLGAHWFATWQPGRRSWLWNLDSDYWKKFIHDGVLTPPGRPGALTLYGDEPTAHKQYAMQLTAEKWTHEYLPGRGDKYSWKPIRQQNHWLDATYIAAAMAAVSGMKTVGNEPPPPGAPDRPAVSQRRKLKLSDLQKERTRT